MDTSQITGTDVDTDTHTYTDTDTGNVVLSIMILVEEWEVVPSIMILVEAGKVLLSTTDWKISLVEAQIVVPHIVD